MTKSKKEKQVDQTKEKIYGILLKDFESLLASSKDIGDGIKSLFDDYSLTKAKFELENGEIIETFKKRLENLSKKEKAAFKSKDKSYQKAYVSAKALEGKIRAYEDVLVKLKGFSQLKDNSEKKKSLQKVADKILGKSKVLSKKSQKTKESYLAKA